jgi:hypothetical protein
LKGKFANVVATQRAASGALSIFETRAFASSGQANKKPSRVVAHLNSIGSATA